MMQSLSCQAIFPCTIWFPPMPLQLRDDVPRPPTRFEFRRRSGSARGRRLSHCGRPGRHGLGSIFGKGSRSAITEIATFRQGCDFRVGLLNAAPNFSLRAGGLMEDARAAEAAAEMTWGRPQHWLRLPNADISLWWPFLASVATLGAWGLSKRPCAGRGFPVTVQPAIDVER